MNNDFAYAIYKFQHAREYLNDVKMNNEHYIQIEHFGADIKQFPAIYPDTSKRRKQQIVGKGFIDCGENKENKADFIGKHYFSYVFGLGKKEDGKSRKKLTGAIQSNCNVNIYVGDNKNIGGNDGLVFEFSDNREYLTVYFFKGRAVDFLNGKLLQDVTDGLLKLTVENLTVSITKEKSPENLSEIQG